MTIPSVLIKTNTKVFSMKKFNYDKVEGIGFVLIYRNDIQLCL